MSKVIKVHEYIIAWFVWLVSTIGVLFILGIFTDILLKVFGINIYTIDTIGIASVKLWIEAALSSFAAFVLVVKHMIVRKVKERVKQEVHQRYQKLLEEKGIQLEDSNV